jgi:transcriptional regulator with XRE-family HTH domain
MTSSSLAISPRRRTYVRLIGEIRHALNQALTEEHSMRGLTKADIARLLGKDKSFVTKKLGGESNMTLETLADLAFAMNRPVKVVMPSRARSGNNQPLDSDIKPQTSFPPPSTKDLSILRIPA